MEIFMNGKKNTLGPICDAKKPASREKDTGSASPRVSLTDGD